MARPCRLTVSDVDASPSAPSQLVDQPAVDCAKASLACIHGLLDDLHLHRKVGGGAVYGSTPTQAASRAMLAPPCLTFSYSHLNLNPLK